LTLDRSKTQAYKAALFGAEPQGFGPERKVEDPPLSSCNKMENSA
jgi:hypothetical protein